MAWRFGRGRRGTFRALVQSVVLLVVGIVLWRFLAIQGGEIEGAVARLGPWKLLSSLLMALMAVWCAWRSWYSIIGGVGGKLPACAARRLYFVSQLGKYVPGAVWPVIMQAQAARTYALRRADLVYSYAAALLVSIVTGAFVAGAAFMAVDPSLWKDYWWVLPPATGSILMLAPSALPRLLSMILRLSGHTAIQRNLSLFQTLRAGLWGIGSWLSLGLHLYALTSALTPITAQLFVRAIGGMALAFVAGLAAVFAPAGAGVREAVLSAALGPVLPPAGALAIVLTSRAILILADLVSAAASTVGWRLRRLKVGRTVGVGWRGPSGAED